MVIYDQFSCDVDVSSWTGKIDGKFGGAATAYDGTVVFAPYNANCVGIVGIFVLSMCDLL